MNNIKGLVKNINTKQIKKGLAMMCIAGVSLISGLMIGITQGEKETKTVKHNYASAFEKMEKSHETEVNKYKSYEMLYNDTKNELNLEKMKVEQQQNQINWYKENIAMAENLKKNSANRGDISTSKLNTNFAVTTEQMNKWLKEKAPKDSPFQGQGKVFIEASKETGLDPMYIAAHAGLESGWGTSPIARDKHNYFGITAYNANPYDSAKSFDSLEDGIIAGAKWIKKYYTDEGQDTLDKMLYGKKSYAQTDDGQPLDSWLDGIVNIIG